MNVNKAAGLLGMCKRSGKLVTGFDAVAALAHEPHVLFLISSDASPRTVRELQFRVGKRPLYRLPLGKEEIAAAIGTYKPAAVLATVDAGFSRALRPICNEEEESHYVG